MTVYAAIATLITTVAAVPLVRRVMLRRGVLDVPNHRSSHNAPIPRGGGIACAGGAAVGSAVAAGFGASVPLSAVFAAIILAGVGFLDDMFHLAAAPRLGAQVVTGAVFGATIGGAGWVIAGAVLLPLIVNVVNFMDGINGITALTILIWGCTTAFAGTLHGQQLLAVLGAVTAGAALGFLPWNAPRAHIFLGDVGSYFFGALAASGILLGASAEISPALLVAPLTISILDVLVTLAKRLIRGAPPLQAHREHVYQRLVSERNLSHTAVSLAMACISMLIVLAWASGIVLVALIATVFAAGIYLSSVKLLGHVAAPSTLSMVKKIDTFQNGLHEARRPPK
ncbi:hypothetical protein [Georgenia muralis]